MVRIKRIFIAKAIGCRSQKSSGSQFMDNSWLFMSKKAFAALNPWQLKELRSNELFYNSNHSNPVAKQRFCNSLIRDLKKVTALMQRTSVRRTGAGIGGYSC